MADPASTPRPPEIQKHQYVRYLGSGGFGDVFQYEQTQHGGSVAVKVLREGAFTEAGRQQFETEAKALGKLARNGPHPNIVAVQTIDEVEGRPYLIMEYCANGSLAGKIHASRGGMDPNEVLRLGIQIAGALHMAHRAGIVHRDIKPGNILFGVGDVPKLGDFGIAAISAEDVDRGSAFLSPDYAAYEVGKWGQADALSDLFSLAATLYEALAGHSWATEPDGDNSEAAVQRRLEAGIVPPIEHAPERLERLLRLAMSRNRQTRQGQVASAEELAQNLHTIQLELRYSPTPVPIFLDSPTPRVQQPPAAIVPTTARPPARPQATPPHAAPPKPETPTGWRPLPNKDQLDETIGRPPDKPPPPDPPLPEPEPEPSRKRIALIAAAVAVVGIVGAAAFLRPSLAEDPGGKTPASVDPGPGGLPEKPVPRPVVTGTRVDADTVRFTWTYEDPQTGDYFRLQRSDASAAMAEPIDKLEWAIDGVTQRLCVTVRVIRADHRAGRDTGEACA